MKYFKYFMSFFLIWSYQHLSSAQMIFIDSPETSLSKRIENQLEILKTSNEELIRRLEMMEQNVDRQNQKFFIEIQTKFNNFEQMIKEQYNALKEFRIENKELSKENKDQLNEVKQLLKENNEAILNYQKKAEDDHQKTVTEVKVLFEKYKSSLKIFNANEDNKKHFIPLEDHTKIINDLKSNATNLQNIESQLTRLHKIELFKMCGHPEDQQELFCTRQFYPTSCLDFDQIYCSNNKCRIQNDLYGSKSFLVSCDNQADGGGWTVIQRRINGSVDFYRDWSEYKQGFGDIDGEFFIGLDKLHALTTSLEPVELLIQLQDFDDIIKYAKYDAFSVGNEESKYILKKLGSYTGNAGDSFSYYKDCKFSTKDQKNNKSSINCAEHLKGAGWFKECALSNLNGLYYKNGKLPDRSQEGIYWHGYHEGYYYLKFVQMMIRPKK